MGLINLGTNYREAIEKSRKRDESILKNTDRFQYSKIQDVSEQLSTLIPVSWDGIYFPVSNFSTDVSYAVVEHKYPNRDSARLESMGRNPMEFHVTAPLVNTIAPGPTDKWHRGLFPNIYNVLFLSSLRNETKILSHPIYGDIKCKMLSFNTDVDAKFRGGVIVNMVFKETIDDKELDAAIKFTLKLIDDMKYTASGMDSMMPNLIPSPADLGIPDYKKSLLDAVNDITNMMAAPGQFAGKLVGAIDSLEGRVQGIITKISQTYSTSWGQANNLAYKLKADVNDLKKMAGVNVTPVTSAVPNQPNTNENISNTTNSNQPTILVFVTEKKSVFTNLAGRLNNTYSELIGLNPLLASKAFIPVNTKVRYYKK